MQERERRSMPVEAVLGEVGEGIAQAQQGDRHGAAARFARLWDAVGPRGDPLARCAVAHSMADVQDELHHELDWDLRALAAAQELTDTELHAAGMAGTVEHLFPSLHLNLADVYHRLGDRAACVAHLGAARVACHRLGDEPYRQMIEAGLSRLAEQLDVAG